MLLKNDCEKGAGVDLAKKYEIRVYPTFAMVNDKGEVTDRWAGFEGVEAIGGQIDRARADMSTIAEKQTRFQSEPTLALARSLAQYSEAVFASTEAVDYYRKISALDPSLTGEMRGKIFMSMYYGLRSGAFTGEQMVAEGEAILANPDADLEQVLMVVSVVRRAAEPDLYVPMLKQALAVTADVTDEDAVAFRRELLVDEALLIDQDKPKAMSLKRQIMAPGWEQDPDGLNQFAWWCFENELNLDEAYTLAVKGADLADGDGARANILDTAAEIAFKLGKIDTAIEHESEAVRLSPDQEAFKQTLQRFEAAKS